MADVERAVAEFEPHEHHRFTSVATLSYWCHDCEKEVAVAREAAGAVVCSICKRGWVEPMPPSFSSSASHVEIRTRDTPSFGHFIGALRLFDEDDNEEHPSEEDEEEEEEDDGGLENYMDCLPQRWIIDDEEENSEEEKSAAAEEEPAWADLVISESFYASGEDEMEIRSENPGLWAEVEPMTFGFTEQPRVRVSGLVTEGESRFRDSESERDREREPRARLSDAEFELESSDYDGHADVFDRNSNVVNVQFAFDTLVRGLDEVEHENSVSGVAHLDPATDSRARFDLIRTLDRDLDLDEVDPENSNPGVVDLNRSIDSRARFDLVDWNPLVADSDEYADSVECSQSVGDSDAGDLCIAFRSWNSFGVEEGSEDVNGEDQYEEWEELYGEVPEVDLRVSETIVPLADEDQHDSRRSHVAEFGLVRNFDWTNVLEDFRDIGTTVLEDFRDIEFTGYEEESADVDADDVDADGDVDAYFGDPEDYADAAGYEVLLEHFAEIDNFPKGAPPAAKVIVDSLPSIYIVQEQIDNGNAWCPICKEVVEIGEPAKQLPCLHHYHGCCILPWLGSRNSCPVCRYELPTDDPEYEEQRKQVTLQI